MRCTKDDAVVFTEEELDFIKEMMNIGAGNAATALEQMLGPHISMKIPGVKLYKGMDTHAIYNDLGDSIQTFTAVVMNLIGEVKGKIVYVVGTKDLLKLILLMDKTTTGRKQIKPVLDLSVVAEIGNILAGTYLNSINVFCTLNIYHSVPKLKTDNLKTLTQDLFTTEDSGNLQIIIVINQFIRESDEVNTYILFVPDKDSMKLIAQSLRQAKDKLSLP